jgi:hypothetical protein
VVTISAFRSLEGDARRTSLRSGAKRAAKWCEKHRENRHNRYAGGTASAVSWNAFFHLESLTLRPKVASVNPSARAVRQFDYGRSRQFLIRPSPHASPPRAAIPAQNGQCSSMYVCAGTEKRIASEKVNFRCDEEHAANDEEEYFGPVQPFSHVIATSVQYPCPWGSFSTTTLPAKER